ncbi:MAG TPA: peptide ABC transporter substrate-binding protein [Candidatus Udaeobacter sp.]|nr:peptide ABC transporter substrate-binding protein [Candidatus Udaeobacter sp.]
MPWSKLFFWIKKKQGYRSAALPSTNFDRKLLKKIRLSSIPSWSQFKYLGSFLTKTEKIALNTALAIFFLGAIGWGIVWFIQNNTIIPASGGDYSEALIGQPKYINPLFASANDVDADLTSLMYSGLFKYDDQQKLITDLADNYSVSQDGKTYDVNLRTNLKWSDGEPLNADDVIYTFESIQDPEVGSPLLTTFQSVQIERTGDYSIRFTLKEPFAPFLNSLTVGILPQHTWSNVPPSAIKLAKTNLQPVGSGPWKFSKLAKDSAGGIQSYTLDLNKNYYKNSPYLQTLTFKFYTDYTAAASALKSQDIMAASFLSNDSAKKIAGKNFQLYKFTLPQYTAIFFNQDAAPVLKDNSMRLALNLAINKQDVLTKGLNSEGEIINSPILKNEIGYNSSIAFPEFNIEKANEILEKNWKKIQPEDFFKIEYDAALKNKQAELDALAKNSASSTEATTTPPDMEKITKEISDTVRQEMDPDQSFYRKNSSNEILAITLTTADTPEYQQVAQTIAKMWRAVGVKTKIEAIDTNQISREALRNRDYQALLYGEIVGNDPDPYPFWHSSQINYPGLNLSLFLDRSADKILEDARALTNEQIRADLYEKFQQILAKEVPAVFLYTPTYNFLANKQIKGITFQQIFSPADRFNNLNNWYIKTKRQWKK